MSSSRQGASATCPSAPCSSGDAAGSNGHGLGGSQQEVAHLAMVVSDDDDFTNDPHQIIPMEEVQRRYVASKLHSGTAAYSSYISLILTGIVYPQHEDLLVPINQYNYFDIIGTILPITNHGIWGCLHFLPLVLNIFLACYHSETFL